MVSRLSSGEVKNLLSPVVTIDTVDTVAEQQNNFHGTEVLVVMHILQGKSILKVFKHKPLPCREVA